MPRDVLQGGDLGDAVDVFLLQPDTVLLVPVDLVHDVELCSQAGRDDASVANVILQDVRPDRRDPVVGVEQMAGVPLIHPSLQRGAERLFFVAV